MHVQHCKLFADLLCTARSEHSNSRQRAAAAKANSEWMNERSQHMCTVPSALGCRRSGLLRRRAKGSGLADAEATRETAHAHLDSAGAALVVALVEREGGAVDAVAQARGVARTVVEDVAQVRCRQVTG